MNAITTHDVFEDYEKIAWYWFTLHLVMAAKISGLSREAKDKEWNILLRSLGVPVKRQRKPAQEGVAR